MGIGKDKMVTAVQQRGCKQRPNSIPSGWQAKRLNEICRQDRTIIDPNSYEASKRPYLGLENVESETGRILQFDSSEQDGEGKSTTFSFDDRHVLYGKLRPYLNKVALPNFTGRCTTELIPLLPSELTCREFLAWTLRRRETVAAAMKEKTGSRMPRADMNELLEMVIAVPPLAEQRRIAAILNEQMEAVERARRAAVAQLDTALNLTSAQLRTLFHGRDSESWPKRRVGELCEDIDYGFTASADFGVTEPRFLRITDIQNGQVNWGSVPGCRIECQNEQKHALKNGDIVFARTGATTGKSFLLRDPPRAVFASYLIRLRPTGDIEPDFMYAFFQSENYWRQVRAQARGGAQPNVNATLLGKIVLPCPSIDQQRRVVAIMSKYQEQHTRIVEAIHMSQATIDTLPAVLLREAFSGRL